jgi:twitching motility protein PilT
MYSQMQIGQDSHGMVLLNQSLSDLYMRRLVTLDEALSASANPDELREIINSGGRGPVGSSRTAASRMKKD